jgi:hypothetical protein
MIDAAAVCGTQNTTKPAPNFESVVVSPRDASLNTQAKAVVSSQSADNQANPQPQGKQKSPSPTGVGTRIDLLG